MKKIFAFITFSLCVLNLLSQETNSSTLTPSVKKKEYKGRKLPGRDHFMLQFGYLSLNNQPDSIADLTKGKFHRYFNMHFMYDFELKKNSPFSFAAGIGTSYNNTYLKDGYIDLIDRTNTNRQTVFQDLSDTIHYKKSKLTTVTLDVPFEIRYSSNPQNFSRGVKVALGIKFGILLNSYTKSVTLLNASGGEISDPKIKEYNTDFIQPYNWVSTFRIGWGITTFSVSYQLNSIFRENRGPVIQPLTFGICVSGL